MPRKRRARRDDKTQSADRGMDRTADHRGIPGIRPVAICFGVMTIVRRRLQAVGIRDHPTAPRSPWQNGRVERLIGSIRRKCLDHIVVVGEVSLHRTLKAYARYSTRSERTACWKRICRRLVRLRSLDRSSHALCLADLTITMFGFRLSAPTGGAPAVLY
jgi:Integrase core domain